MNYKQLSRLPLSEQANVLTHLVGFLGGVVALVLMVNLAASHENQDKIISSWVFGLSLCLLYMASTLYHLAASQRTKELFKIIDHSAIFVLIAGTYTPFALVSLEEETGCQLLWIIWGIATLGIAYKIFLTGKFKVFSTIVYLLMGWVAIFYIVPIYNALPKGGMLLLLAGGLSYSLGVIFYLRKNIFSHAVWHLFVLGGSLFHFFAIYYFVLPT